MKIETKYDCGDLVSPVIAHDITMMIVSIWLRHNVVQYDCCWFVEGDMKVGLFNDFEIEPSNEKPLGFGKE